MSVIDEFLILFKSNAKDTEKDIRNVQESTEKSRLKLNEADKQAESLSDSLLKVGLQGLAAFASFEGIKSGIINAANFNAQLEKLHQTTGANQKELAAYDATFAQFGSSTGEFSSAFESIAHQVLQMGGNVQAIIPNIRELGKEMYALEKAHPGKAGEDAARALFERRNALLGGALPASLELGLLKDPEAFDKVLEKQRQIQDVTEGNTAAGLKLESAWKEFSTSAISVFTPLIPILTGFVNLLTDAARGLHVLVDLVTGNWSDIIKHGTAAATGNPIATSSGGFGSTRGMRNNNPGNLRSWGNNPIVDGFAQFPTLQAGLSAEDRQLALYGSRGINTPAAIISKWAPSSENNTAAYISAVSKSTGFGANQQLDLSDPSVRQKIANAINAQENGASYGNLASNSNSNVTIGSVVVNTQATDAKGIAADMHQSLWEQLSYTAAGANDGIAK